MWEYDKHRDSITIHTTTFYCTVAVWKHTQLAVGAELWGSGIATTPLPMENPISSLSLTYTCRCRWRCTHKNDCIRTAWISASRLSASRHLLGNICSTDDDRAMLLLLEISHPALFTDRCHGILDFALWIVNIWWSISKLGGGFTYLVCAAHIGLWEILYKQLNHERHLQNIVADLLEM